MTTPIESFNRKECCLIPGTKINAYVDISLDPENPTGIILDTTWGQIKLDLLSIVKAGETVTHLRLTDTGLCYEREDGETEYISGDDLSRVISLTLLKDIDQSKTIEGGDVYIYNGDTNLFEPFDLKTFVDNVNTHLGRIDATLNQYNNRLTAIEQKLTPPADAPSDVRVAFGNINDYADINYTGSNTLNKNHGIYTHELANDVVDDEVFS